MASDNPQIRSRILPKTYRYLVAQSRASGMTMSEITDAALRMYLKNKEAEVQENALLKRFDHTERQLFRVDRDLKILTDAFTLYLQYFFTVTPEIPSSQSDVRAAQGVKHLHDFMDSFREFVGGGGANIKNAVEDILVTDQSYFTDEDLEKLKENRAESVS